MRLIGVLSNPRGREMSKETRIEIPRPCCDDRFELPNWEPMIPDQDFNAESKKIMTAIAERLECLPRTSKVEEG